MPILSRKHKLGKVLKWNREIRICNLSEGSLRILARLAEFDPEGVAEHCRFARTEVPKEKPQKTKETSCSWEEKANGLCSQMNKNRDYQESMFMDWTWDNVYSVLCDSAAIEFTLECVKLPDRKRMAVCACATPFAACGFSNIMVWQPNSFMGSDQIRITTSEETSLMEDICLLHAETITYRRKNQKGWSRNHKRAGAEQKQNRERNARKEWCLWLKP